MKIPGNKATRFSGSALVLALLLVLAGTASASTVSVQETSGDTNQVQLSYRADPGEDNHLTITALGKPNHVWELHISDSGAVVVAGSGCSTGMETTCDIHEPKGFDYGTCTGHDCLPPTLPGTAWHVQMDIALADGDDYFDGSVFTEKYNRAVDMRISSGAGSDQISTGGGSDRIDPGAGSDVVRSGEGEDRVEATATPDGPDAYESGNGVDTISYAQRNDSVHLNNSTAGAEGENDSLTGYFSVVGGSGDDILDGGKQNPTLDGGAGDDILSGVNAPVFGPNLHGGPGNDRLSTEGEAADHGSHMFGEEGDDTYYGGPGSDIIREVDSSSVYETFEGLTPDLSSGNDVAYGGDGDDAIELRTGNDQAYGGPGDDSMQGGLGEDRLAGETGDDLLIGGAGFDRLVGGDGNDRFFSRRWRWNNGPRYDSFPFPPVRNDGADSVKCGADRDLAFANPWDRLRGCEIDRLKPRPRHGSRR